MKNLMRHSYTCMSIHGGIDQYDRDSTMDDFKAGNIKLLVTTTNTTTTTGYYYYYYFYYYYYYDIPTRACQYMAA